MIQKLCNGKTDKTDEKIVEARTNQGDGDSNTDSQRLKVVSLPSTIELIILINLQLRSGWYKKVRKGKTDETNEKNFEVQRNLGDGDSNTNSKRLKFDSLSWTID